MACCLPRAPRLELFLLTVTEADPSIDGGGGGIRDMVAEYDARPHAPPPPLLLFCWGAPCCGCAPLPPPRPAPPRSEPPRRALLGRPGCTFPGRAAIRTHAQVHKLSALLIRLLRLNTALTSFPAHTHTTCAAQPCTSTERLGSAMRQMTFSVPCVAVRRVIRWCASNPAHRQFDFLVLLRASDGNSQRKV